VPRTASVVLAMAMFTGCSSMQLADFADRQPTIRPEQFFVGSLSGWGLEVGPLGGIGRRLEVTAVGGFDPATQTLSLAETYRFDDGHMDRLDWRIRKGENGRYIAHEQRIAEPGDGEAAGCAFHLTYTRSVPQADGSRATLNFDDWFIQIDDNTLVVRASIRKLMIETGSMTVLYRRNNG
jgi:Protein of unknown function (DUF3833)